MTTDAMNDNAATLEEAQLLLPMQGPAAPVAAAPPKAPAAPKRERPRRTPLVAPPVETPCLDAVYAVLSATLPAPQRWTLKGWAAHMRATRHQNHAANSWARHRHEFDDLHDRAEALVVARCVDYGMDAEDAAVLMEERIAAHIAKNAA